MNMKGEVTKILHIMEGTDKILKIPVYQRNYDWLIDNVQKLIEDLEMIAKTGVRSHFFGSVVTQQEDDREVIVIDGQQRLTTLSLILVAMKQLLDINPEDDVQSELIYETYLINRWDKTGNRKYKLQSIHRDKNAYEKLFSADPSNYYHPSNITTNYEYIFNSIEKSAVSVSDLFHAVEKLEVMQLNVQADDDAQLIFESINSTGLDLTDADKVRNLLLMNENYEKQVEYFETYWEPIEKHTNFNVPTLLW